MTKYSVVAALVVSFAGLIACVTAQAQDPPAEKMFPSAIGEVIFRHQAHVQERGIACADCHHQINAKKLKTAHPDYFKSSWINCEICHNDTHKAKPSFYSCSACHQANTKNIADETLSAKVVIHQQCWKCHAIGAGKDASSGCSKCHFGKRL